VSAMVADVVSAIVSVHGSRTAWEHCWIYCSKRAREVVINYFLTDLPSENSSSMAA